MSWSIKYEGLITCVGIDYPEEDFVSLKSSHGFKLATYRFHRENPSALIFLFHGLHKASSDMAFTASYLYDQGFAVAAFDQEGQGKSEGERGTMSSLNDQANDCIQFILRTKELYRQNIPVFCAGVTLGGGLCVKVALMRPELVNGVILYGPTLGIDPNFSPVLQKIVGMLHCCCCREVRLKAIDQSRNCRNPHYASYCNENPGFFSGKMNVKTGYAILVGLRELEQQLASFSVPVLLFHGEKDQMRGFVQSAQFIKTCESSDKEIILFPECFHALIHEPEFPEALNKTVNWIRDRI